MEIECDVLVVGAGPAGSVAALYCSKNGLNTVLIEKNDRIGAHVNTKIDASTDSDLTSIIKELRLKTENLVYNSKWHAPSGNFFTLHSKTGEYYFKRGPDRDSFESLTVESAVRKGCKLFLKSAIEDIKEDEEKIYEVRVEREGKTTIIRPKVLVAADGGNSIFHKFVSKCSSGRKKVGCGVTGKNFTSPGASEVYFDADLIPGGYFYIVTCPDGTSSACIVLDSSRMEKPAKNYFDDYLRKTPRVAEKIKSTTNNFGGEGEIFDLDTYFYKNLLFVGDAAGLIDPFLGYGMRPAIVSGYNAGRYCLGAVKNGDHSPLNDYDKEMKQRFDKGLPHLYHKILNSLNNGDFEVIIHVLNELQGRVDIDDLIHQLHS